MKLATLKNDIYRQSLSKMNSADLSREVKDTLDKLRAKGLLLAIGSSSKNSKPDPEVFLKATEFLGLSPEDCLVVEDALVIY